ncbi:hypothetical protein Ahy_B03g062192 [Arachis hypogaea]|uniref:RRM domain-containing protein n=1 Tax=Arachis hypogaea TaxID=3818 RepID=A0A444ZTB8_ARAHY|nr:hypothetical protein Ahy_B03g062192 [Arachis hypogaea]
MCRKDESESWCATSETNMGGARPHKEPPSSSSSWTAFAYAVVAVVHPHLAVTKPPSSLSRYFNGCRNVEYRSDVNSRGCFKVINDRETGRSRGFRFVTFASEQVMRDAIDGMNGPNFNGCNIIINEAQSREGGRSGGSGGYESGTIIKVDTTKMIVTTVITEKKM